MLRNEGNKKMYSIGLLCFKDSQNADVVLEELESKTLDIGNYFVTYLPNASHSLHLLVCSYKRAMFGPKLVYDL